MRRAPLLLSALTLFATPAFAGDPWPHFVRTGNDFVCQSAADKPAADDTACLHIGPVAVGRSRRSLESFLNKPAQESQTGSGDYFVYIVDQSDPMQAGPITVFATATLSYAADGTAASVQVAGKAMRSHWAFCGLELGASEADLRARMGEPLATSPSSNTPDTTQWSYGPSIAFGVQAGRISFIHISRNIPNR